MSATLEGPSLPYLPPTRPPLPAALSSLPRDRPRPSSESRRAQTPSIEGGSRPSSVLFGDDAGVVAGAAVFWTCLRGDGHGPPQRKRAGQAGAGGAEVALRRRLCAPRRQYRPPGRHAGHRPRRAVAACACATGRGSLGEPQQACACRPTVLGDRCTYVNDKFRMYKRQRRPATVLGFRRRRRG